MTSILVLDIYPKVNYRISKDQNGGYGTANDYGDSLLSKILNSSSGFKNFFFKIPRCSKMKLFIT